MFSKLDKFGMCAANVSILCRAKLWDIGLKSVSFLFTRTLSEAKFLDEDHIVRKHRNEVWGLSCPSFQALLSCLVACRSVQAVWRSVELRFDSEQVPRIDLSAVEAIGGLQLANAGYSHIRLMGHSLGDSLDRVPTPQLARSPHYVRYRGYHRKTTGAEARVQTGPQYPVRRR